MMFTAKDVGNPITLSGSIKNIKIIRGKKFEPTLSTQIKVLLREEVLQRLVVGIENKLLSQEVMMPNFQSEDDGGKF